MSVSQLPSGKWRAQVYDPETGKNRNAVEILGMPAGSTFASKREAKAAREEARKRLYCAAEADTTLAEFWQTWTGDPLYARPKESTNIHNRERTKRFVETYGHLPIARISDDVVSEWLAGRRNLTTVPALCAMFNDARSAMAGRLVSVNPFSGLRLPQTRGNKDNKPPTIEQAWAIIGAARTVACPSFAGWLQVAMFTGMRPGEIDALRWDAVDLDGGLIEVREQFNAKTRTFTSPKNGRKRPVPIHKETREALLAAHGGGEFCFESLQSTHWTASSRAYHWKATRAAVGWEHSLYLATRHFAGSYMVNALGLDSEDVAFALGHQDGGELVRKLYGHRDRDLALERVRRAYAQRENVTSIRRVA